MISHWSVEALPSTPESLFLLPPPQPPCKECCCCACGCESSSPLCRRCAAHFKTKLLDAALADECAQRHYCLECKEVFTENHRKHKEKSIPLGRYKGQDVAWVTGDEAWSSIFESIETSNRGIKPYLLYNKSESPKCEVCRDTVSEDCLYGVMWPYCCLACFVAGDGGPERSLEKAMVTTEYSDDTIGFCITCASAVIRGGGDRHSGHDWLRIRMSSDGLRPRVVVPDDHPKKQAWSSIKSLPGSEVLIKDDSVRCKECRKRLSVGDTCSLMCSLDAACRAPKFSPRQVQLIKSVGGVGRIA